MLEKKVTTYTSALNNMMSSSYNKIYESINDSFYRLRSNTIYCNKIINTSAQFVIKYKVTLAGYLSAIAATSSSQVA